MRKISIIFIISFFMFFTLLSKPTVAWWNFSWNYRRPITISSTDFTGKTNATIIIEDIDVEGARSDCKDLRLTIGEAGNEYPFLLYNCKNNKVNLLLKWNITGELTGNTTFYLYYGNPDANQYASWDWNFKERTNIDSDAGGYGGYGQEVYKTTKGDLLMIHDWYDGSDYHYNYNDMNGTSKEKYHSSYFKYDTTNLRGDGGIQCVDNETHMWCVARDHTGGTWHLSEFSRSYQLGTESWTRSVIEDIDADPIGLFKDGNKLILFYNYNGWVFRREKDLSTGSWGSAVNESIPSGASISVNPSHTLIVWIKYDRGADVIYWRTRDYPTGTWSSEYSLSIPGLGGQGVSDWVTDDNNITYGIWISNADWHPGPYGRVRLYANGTGEYSSTDSYNGDGYGMFLDDDLIYLWFVESYNGKGRMALIPLSPQLDWINNRQYFSLDDKVFDISIGAEEKKLSVYEPKTYNENYVEKTSFIGGDKVVIRVNVTDPQGAEDINKVLITIIDNSSVVQVSNESMTNVSSITNGYTYEYNYTLPTSSTSGLWTINVYANDTQNFWNSNSTTFEVTVYLNIYLPYGDTYGRNETVLVNGTVTKYPSTVYLWYYNSSLTLENATLWDSYYTENGYYEFEWYNESLGKFTLYVNVTGNGQEISNSTNVTIINPIDITNLSPTIWYYDRKQRNKNFYTEMLNITSNRPIDNITFTTNQPSGYTQPFYLSDAYGAYHNCTDLDINELCYMTYRYANFPYSATRTISNGYTIYYENGNYYEGSYSYTLNIQELVKNVEPFEVFKLEDVFVGNGTKSGEYQYVYRCGVYDYTRNYISNNFYPYSFNITLNTSISFIKIVPDFVAVEDDYVDGTFKGDVYIDGNKVISVWSDITTETGGDCYWAYGSAWYIIEGMGTHNITFEPTQGYSALIGADYADGEWLINYTVSFYIYAFNDTNYQIVNFTDLNSKTFEIGDKYEIAEKSYMFETVSSTTSRQEQVTYYHYINENLFYQVSLTSGPAGYTDHGFNASFTQDKLVSGSNTFKLNSTLDSTGYSVDVHWGVLYISKNDFNITYVNITMQDIPNLKDRTIDILWLGQKQNLTYKIQNLAPYTLSPTLYLIGPPHIISEPITITLSPNETKYVTFNVTVLDIEPARGFGLDTIFVIANSTNGTFGFTYNTFRTLPLNNATVMIQAPYEVQAGGLFSIYTRFTPLNYSIFYPHVIFDLDGTFGYEVGVSSANIGGNYTSGRCFDVTLWTDMYEPGVTLAYTETEAGTVFTSDSLRIVPQHRFYIYDKYGFFNITKDEDYEMGKILVGYGILQPGNWKMTGVYDFHVNGFCAESGMVYSDYDLGRQFLYKFLDITEVPQSINIISGTNQPLPSQLFNWIAWYPKNFPAHIYQSGGSFYVRTYPTDPSTYWIPCLSSGYAPVIPPFNIYIEYIKTGDEAFTIPASERLAVIDNQLVNKGDVSEGVYLKAIAPLEAGLYNITVIVFDDAETGLYWYNTTTIKVISPIPSPGIVVREVDYNVSTVKAVNVSQTSWITMQREVWVRNENPYDVSVAVWYASPLPEDAIYLSGDLSGTITNFGSGEEVNPSNVTYKVPGISAWVDKYIYTIGEPQTTKKLLFVKLKIYNNATKTPQYNIIVNRTEFVPSGFEPEEEIKTIDSLSPKAYVDDSYYALGEDLTYPIDFSIQKETIPKKGITLNIWTIEFTNPSSTDVANYTYRVYLPLEANNITLNDSSIDVLLDDFGYYLDIDLNLNPNESKTYIIKFSTFPVTVDVSPPSYPSRFWVGEYATLIIKVKVKNWAPYEVENYTEKIDIPYGENLTVLLNGEEIDFEDLVQGYYELNITNLSAYESREYLILYKSPVADAFIKPYSRTIINESQYIFYPIRIRSLASFPMENIYIRFRHNKPYTCKDVAWIWRTDEASYINIIPKKVEELDFECENNDTIVELAPFSGPGEEQYIMIFVTEIKSPPYPQISQLLYSFFEGLINIIRGFIDFIIQLFT